MLNYWNFQRDHLCQEIGKENPETSLIMGPDEYRKRVEQNEIIEKSSTHIPHMDGVVWRS